MKTIYIDDIYKNFFVNLATEDVLELIGASDVNAIGILEEDEGGKLLPVGIIVAETDAFTTEIVWLYIDEKHRNKGYAKKLLDLLSNSIDIEEYEHHLMAFSNSENTEITSFLSHFGFIIDDDNANKLYETTIKALLSGKLNLNKSSGKTKTFNDVPNIALSTFNENCKSNFPDILASFPVKKEDYLPCSVAYVKDEQILGMVLYKKEFDDSIALVFQFNDSGSSQILIEMLSDSLQLLKEQYPEDKIVKLYTMDKFAEIVANQSLPISEEVTLTPMTYKVNKKEI